MTKGKNNYSRSINHGITCLIELLLFLQLLPYATAQTGDSPPPPNAFSFNPKFSSSMAIILVVLISAFFFMGFFSVYIRQCAEYRLRGSLSPIPMAGSRRRSRRVARGLDVAVIETFPTFVYSTVKGLKIGKGSLECAVCLNEFQDDETLRLLPICNHVFHPDCIDAWLACQTTCPVCRANLVPKPDDISYPELYMFDTDIEPDEPVRAPIPEDSGNQVLIRMVDDPSSHIAHIQSPNVDVRSPIQLTNQNRPPRSRSTGFKITGKFPRSHSTGHSLVQPGEDCERFTLRLPEKVRSQIMNSTLNRTKSCVAFPSVRSTRRGYRSCSVGSGRGKNYFNYERFDRDTRSDRWGFSITPLFISRSGSVRSPKVVSSEEVTATPKTPLRFIKSPFDRLFLGTDNNNHVGERSSDRLRSDDLV